MSYHQPLMTHPFLQRVRTHDEWEFLGRVLFCLSGVEETSNHGGAALLAV